MAVQSIECGVNTLPAGCVVPVTKENDDAFIVTNTPTPPDKPDDPDEPDEPDIPQTGLLWWPGPLLACGGMGLFLVSWLKRRNSDYDEADE